LSFFCLFFPFVRSRNILFYTCLSFLSFSMSSSFPFIYLICVLCYLLFLHFLLSLFVILLMFLLLSVCIFSPSVVRSVSFSFTNSFCSVLHRCYKNVFDIFKKSDFFLWTSFNFKCKKILLRRSKQRFRVNSRFVIFCQPHFVFLNNWANWTVIIVLTTMPTKCSK
jgi:hypothetical protein